MKWPAPILEARLIKRYKRFFADFTLADGVQVTAHCPNTGSMVTCLAEDAPAWLTYHDNPKRKLKYSWQAVHMPDGWVGIHTGQANRLVEEAVRNGVIAELQGYDSLKSEQRYGERSRIDFLLESENRPSCYVEVKNVTLLLDDGIVGFPDAATSRGVKHILELERMVSEGKRAVLIYCVQRASAEKVAPADRFDPVYAGALRQAVANGLEVYAYRAELKPDAFFLNRSLPVLL